MPETVGVLSISRTIDNRYQQSVVHSQPSGSSYAAKMGVSSRVKLSSDSVYYTQSIRNSRHGSWACAVSNKMVSDMSLVDDKHIVSLLIKS